MSETPWLSEREADAWSAVRGLGQPLWAALGRDLLRDSGLSMADYEVLVVLSAQAGDTTAYRDLAVATGWEKSRLSHQLTRMEGRGLLRRTECCDDGRSANITLTEAGRATIEKAAPGHVLAVRRLLIDQLTSDQLDALIAIGAQVDHAIGAESACWPRS